MNQLSDLSLFTPESFRASQKETACFTGHRFLQDSEKEYLKNVLGDIIQHAYDLGYRTFLSGAALGFDTLAGESLLLRKKEIPDLRLVLAIPCTDQSRHWNKKEKEEYMKLLHRADQVILVSDSPYWNGCMQNRNRYMVDHASLCISYLTHFRGGTYQTVRYCCGNPGKKLWYIHQPLSYSMREINECCYTSISLSAEKNADIATLFHMRELNPAFRNISMR